MENPGRLEENFDVFSAEIGVLKHLRDEVARRGEPRMNQWLENVQGKVQELNEVRKELNEIQRGCYPKNIKARVKLNKKVIEGLKAVKELKKEGNCNVLAHRVGSAAVPQGTMLHGNDGSESIEKFLSEMAKERPLRFSHRKIRSFTSNLSSRVGSGAYGEVYKGQFPNGVQIAVKVLKDNVPDVLKNQFMAEVSTMGRTYHRNLVRLYGFCFDAEMKALIYEYMENGSLDKILYENRLNVEWEKLYGIAIDTAKGISYLHENCHKRIIHYDIKAGNVLLDSNLCPKVTDFGMAKLCNRDLSRVTLTGFRGTPGYAAPEVWMPLPVSYKCDIYSFGMMLFEVLGRRKNLNNSLGKGKMWFPRQVWDKYEKGQLDEIMENCCIEERDRENAKILALVALWCAQYMPRERPSMSTVVKILEGEIQVRSPPNPFAHLISSGVDSSVTLASTETMPSLVSSSTSITRYGSPRTGLLAPMNLLSYSRGSSKVSPGLDERQVETVHSSLEPTVEVENKTEEGKLDSIKPEEQKEKLITVVLKVYMHCEDCAHKILKCLKRVEGVCSAEADLNSSQVTVKGVALSPLKLVEYVYKRTRKRAEIVKTESEETEEEKAMLKTEQINKQEENGVVKTKRDKRKEETTKEAMIIINSDEDEEKEEKMVNVKTQAKKKCEEKIEEFSTAKTKQDMEEENGSAKRKLEKRKEDKGIIETEPRWRDEKKGKELEGIIAKTRSDKQEEEDNAKEKMIEKRAEKDKGGQGDNTEKETIPKDAKQVEEEERTKGRAEPKNSDYYFYYPYEYRPQIHSYEYTPQIFSDENPNAWCSIQ